MKDSGAGASPVVPVGSTPKEGAIEQHDTTGMMGKSGRMFWKLFPDGTPVNHTLAEEGLCWWYRKYAPGNVELEKLEPVAREACGPTRLRCRRGCGESEVGERRMAGRSGSYSSENQ